MRCEVRTEMAIKSALCCKVIPFGLIESYKRFGGKVTSPSSD